MPVSLQREIQRNNNELIFLDNAFAAFMPATYVSRMSREEKDSKHLQGMQELEKFRVMAKAAEAQKANGDEGSSYFGS